jgi:drug/metabolite transporter (DMT)-like permease
MDAAHWCWVVASRRLPRALSAQLIVAETLFGLAYGFIFEGRLASPAEAIGGASQFVGVCSAIAAFSKPRSTTMATQIS